MRLVALATGIEMAVHEFGAGEPVLLLHAWGETHRSFDRLVPLLPSDWHLVVPDLRGVGDTAKPLGGYGLGEAVDDVIALLDALGLADCWLVGTSSGGYLSQQVAIEHPERVRGLVLIGAPNDLQGPVPDEIASTLAGLHDPVTRADVTELFELIPLHSPVPAGFLADQTTAALTIPGRVWHAVVAGLVAALPPTRDGRIEVPTLILSGADDEVLPAGQVHELAAAIPSSRLVLYGATGHLVLWERPHRVAADLIAFVTEGK